MRRGGGPRWLARVAAFVFVFVDVIVIGGGREAARRANERARHAARADEPPVAVDLERVRGRGGE